MKREFYVEREEREICKVVRLMERIDDGFGNVYTWVRMEFVIDKRDGSVARICGSLFNRKQIGVMA